MNKPTKTITQKQYNDLMQFRRKVAALDKEIDKIFNTASRVVDDASDEFFDVIVNGDSLDSYLTENGIEIAS